MQAKRKALIVDDDPDILKIGEISLAEVAEWRVLLAASGDECLDLAERERPDVVLLDLMMPNGGGAATLAALKKNARTAEIPVIMMTARGEDDASRACLREGAKGIIKKPFDPLSLSDRIGEILEGGS